MIFNNDLIRDVANSKSNIVWLNSEPKRPEIENIYFDISPVDAVVREFLTREKRIGDIANTYIFNSFKNMVNYDGFKVSLFGIYAII